MILYKEKKYDCDCGICSFCNGGKLPPPLPPEKQTCGTCEYEDVDYNKAPCRECDHVVVEYR